MDILTIFFIFIYVLSNIFGEISFFSYEVIIESYLFSDGIGFVWVIKVYLVLAIFTPFALVASRSGISNFIYFVALLVVYLIYELVVFAVKSSPSVVLNNVESLGFIPYVLIYFYSFRLSLLRNRQIAAVAVASLFIFLLLVVWKYVIEGFFVSTQAFKYPPTIYYLSYAFFAINSLFIFLRSIDISSVFTRSALAWLSSNSFWIYLWHILFYYLWIGFLPLPEKNLIWSGLMMAYLFSFSMLMVYLQIKIVVFFTKRSNFFERRIAGYLVAR